MPETHRNPPRQTAAAALPDRLWDVAIVGAGPAGATAAAQLARRGHTVVVIERHRFPRDKVCGDGLIADALGALDRLGALPQVEACAHEVAAVSVYSSSRLRVDLPGRFLTLKRVELDAIIAGRAEAAGATFAEAAVSGLQPHSDCVELSVIGRAEPIRAQFALLATGADIALPQRLGLVQSVAPSAIALRCYVRSPVRMNRLIISYDREILPGYAWIFPLREGEFNVGCGIFFRHGERGEGNLRSIFQKFVSVFPEAREIVNGADGPHELKGARLRCGLQVPARTDVPRVLMIGETTGTTFPFTGEGIGKAMESAEIAADTIHTALENRARDPRVAATFVRRISDSLAPKYRGYRAAERWLARPWFTDLLARRARHSRFLREAAAGILNETIDPRSVFSLSGIAKSFLK